MSDNSIGWIGGVYFLGFAVSSGIVPPYSDSTGRKVPYFSSLCLQLIAYLNIFLSKNLLNTQIWYFVVGLCAGGRVAIGTTYLNEFISVKYQNAVTTMINVGDSSTMIF